MITLTVFVQGLRETKRKASFQHNKESEYMGESNESLPDLSLLDRRLPKLPVPQIRPQGLEGTRRGITFVVS